MIRAQFAAHVMALGALAGCGRPEARPPVAAAANAAAVPPLAPAEMADSLEARIEARRGSLVRKPGNTVAGNAVSQWTAYYAGDSLLLIDDSTSLGEYGGSRARFYYDAGRLRLYHQSVHRMRGRTGARRDSTVDVRIVFDENGAAAVTQYRLDGRDAELPAASVDDVRTRSADLVRRLVLGR